MGESCAGKWVFWDKLINLGKNKYKNRINLKSKKKKVFFFFVGNV